MTWVQVLLLLARITLAFLRCTYILLKIIFNKLFPPEEKKLHGEVALVTGAGQGLGRELAWHLAHEGCVVICVDINASTNTATVDRMLLEGFPARGYAYDISDKRQVQELAERVFTDVGRVDILVNNAAIFHCYNAPGKDRMQKEESLFRINTLSHFSMVQAFLPGMLERNHGHIVAVSSLAVLLALGGAVTYCASKSAISGMMMSLSEELRVTGNTNIKTTCVFPYIIEKTPASSLKSFLLPPLKVQYVAEEIIQGIKEDSEWFAIPRYMGLGANFIRMLPKEMADTFKEIFQPVSSVKPYELFNSDIHMKGVK